MSKGKFRYPYSHSQATKVMNEIKGVILFKQNGSVVLKNINITNPPTKAPTKHCRIASVDPINLALPWDQLDPINHSLLWEFRVLKTSIEENG